MNEEPKEEKRNSPIKNFFSSKIVKIILTILLDIAFAIAAFAIARSIIFAAGADWMPADFELIDFLNNEIWIAAVFVIVTVGMLAALDTYRSIWKKAGKVGLFKVFLSFVATAGILLLLTLIMAFAASVFIMPQILLVYLLFAAFFCLLIRYAYSIRNYIIHLRQRISIKRLGKNYKGEKPLLRTLVIGSDSLGDKFIKMAFSNPQNGYLPVAILDDELERRGKKLSGIAVYGGLDKLESAIRRFRVELIVIAIAPIDKSSLKEIYFDCVKYNVHIEVASIKDSEKEMDESSTIEVKEIKIEELLEREEFEINSELLFNSVKDKSVLVTGAAGSIGGELCRQCLQLGAKEVIVFDIHENGLFEINEELRKNKEHKDKYKLAVGSVQDKERLEEVIKEYAPEVVFHAAAYKHVPIMEFSATEAIKNNVFGTKNLIEACEANGTKQLMLISTDKAASPSSVMGASKRIAEMLVVGKAEKSSMRISAIRLVNALGSNGSVVPIFLKQIKEGGPITLTDKQAKRYFTTIPEAVRLVLQASSFAKNGDIFVLDAKEPILIYDLACDLIRLNGLEPEKDIAILITGLREGEEVFEGLSYNKEEADSTIHKGIFRLKQEEVSPQTIEKHLQKLKKAIESKQVDVIKKTMLSILS